MLSGVPVGRGVYRVVTAPSPRDGGDKVCLVVFDHPRKQVIIDSRCSDAQRLKLAFLAGRHAQEQEQAPREPRQSLGPPVGIVPQDN